MTEPAEPTLGDILGRAFANSEPMTNVSPLVGAAWGDLDDLRTCAMTAYESAGERNGAGCIAGLAEALSFARMAAVHGTSDDLRSVVFLYGQIAAECRNAGDMQAGDSYEAQGYLLAEMMAEQGDEEMAAMVVGAASAVSTGAHIEAKRLRESIGC